MAILAPENVFRTWCLDFHQTVFLTILVRKNLSYAKKRLESCPVGDFRIDSPENERLESKNEGFGRWISFSKGVMASGSKFSFRGTKGFLYYTANIGIIIYNKPLLYKDPYYSWEVHFESPKKHGGAKWVSNGLFFRNSTWAMMKKHLVICCI